MQNGGLVGDVAVGVGGVALKADAFARLNDNALLISRDFDCTGEKGDKLGGTPQMRLRLPMAAGSQLHIVDGELPVFIVRKKAVRRYIENYQKPDFDLAIQGTLRYRDTTGFHYEVLTDDPAVRKAVKDILFDFFDVEEPCEEEDYTQTMGGM